MLPNYPSGHLFKTYANYPYFKSLTCKRGFYSLRLKFNYNPKKSYFGGKIIIACRSRYKLFAKYVIKTHVLMR